MYIDMVDFKQLSEKMRADKILRQTIQQLNDKMEEPLSPPRRTKIKKLTRKERRSMPQAELIDAQRNNDSVRKPPKKVINLTKRAAAAAEELQQPAARIGRPSIKQEKPVPAGMTRRGALATQDVETYWTLPYLAKKANIQEQLARIWLRKAGIKKPGTRWRWREGSKELERVRKVFAAHLDTSA
jgi:hypothetical protein